MRKKCALYTGKYGTCNESLFMVDQKFEFTNLSYFTLSNSIISLKRIESLLFSIPHTSYSVHVHVLDGTCNQLQFTHLTVLGLADKNCG